jgi:hypothetical protein
MGDADGVALRDCRPEDAGLPLAQPAAALSRTTIAAARAALPPGVMEFYASDGSWAWR